MRVNCNGHTYDEAASVLEKCGFAPPKKPKGSHRTWRHKDLAKHLCLVDKGHGAIPGGYIREMIAAIDEVQQVSPKSNTDA